MYLTSQRRHVFLSLVSLRLPKDTKDAQRWACRFPDALIGKVGKMQLSCNLSSCLPFFGSFLTNIHLPVRDLLSL